MRLVILASAAILLAAGTPAIAQNAVDTDSIVKSLTPHAGAVDANTRGIKHMSTGTNAAGTAASAAASAQPSASLLVLFASGSADLSDNGRAQLDKLGAALKTPGLSKSHFRIEGHTDTTGDDQTNLALSERRANAVVAYLVSQFGIDPAQLVAVGMGKQGLAVETPDQTAEPRNRRVVVINLDG